MKLQTLMIDAASKLLVNPQLWEDVKVLVSDIDDSKKLTGAEKHAKVLDDLKMLFNDVAIFTLNLAVSLAVAWLRSLQVK